MTTPKDNLKSIIGRLENAGQYLDQAEKAIKEDDHDTARQHIQDAKDALFPADELPQWERRAEDLGNQLIELLSLKTNQAGRIDTSWGDKTALGLGLTVRRVVDENGKAAYHG